MMDASEIRYNDVNTRDYYNMTTAIGIIIEVCADYIK